MVVKSFAVKTGSDAGGPICLAPAACQNLSAKLLTAAVLQLHALLCVVWPPMQLTVKHTVKSTVKHAVKHTTKRCNLRRFVPAGGKSGSLLNAAALPSLLNAKTVSITVFRAVFHCVVHCAFHCVSQRFTAFQCFCTMFHWECKKTISLAL